jgi:type I restriction enzyme S subunit
MLVGMSGALGRISRYKLETPALQNQRTGLLLCHPEVPRGFIELILKFVEPQIVGQGKGIAVQNVSGKDIEACAFPLPPISEQLRIVEFCEEMFPAIDAAVAALKRVQANLKRYRASVLKAACEGRLVSTEAELAHQEGRSYESGERLLQRILNERRARWEADQLAKMHASGKRTETDDWKRKYREPAPPDTAGLPELPKGWAWASVDQLSKYVRNGISVKPEGDSGVRILRISAVRPLRVDVEDVRYLSESDEWEDYELDQGDLLFTRYNGNREFVGVCGSVKNLTERTVHPDKLIRVVLLADLILPGYLEVMANSGSSREFMQQRIRTTAGQSGISGEDVKHMPIPLCPITEQERICLDMDARLSNTVVVDQQVTLDVRRATRLRQSILKRAFEGKLVPQDPNDEHASVLLDRIRAERLNAEGAVTPRIKRSSLKKAKMAAGR